MYLLCIFSPQNVPSIAIASASPTLQKWPLCSLVVSIALKYSASLCSFSVRFVYHFLGKLKIDFRVVPLFLYRRQVKHGIIKN